MSKITIELTEEQQKALSEGKSITITPSVVSGTTVDYRDLQYPYGKTFLIDFNTVSSLYKGEDKHNKNLGVYRKHLKNAERDLKLKTQLLKLGALVEVVQEELGDTFEPDWGNKYQNKSMVYYNHLTKCYCSGVYCTQQLAGVIYMSQNVADRVVEILNQFPDILETP